ncbi:hypothetical protein ACIRYZ_43515 [Kitasatospora sp. NPDC101155]|uniref:hypothetical protein n=1 Tax=Kitasatospora sp. NPDC101155 TaxID=3364097 RepID=UPI0038133222
MSRKHHTKAKTTTRLVVKQPAPAHDDTVEQRLAGQIAKGAASGTARAIVTWLIGQVTEHLH